MQQQPLAWLAARWPCSHRPACTPTHIHLRPPNCLRPAAAAPPSPFALQPRDQLRYNLLRIPQVRAFLRSSLWPEDINFK